MGATFHILRSQHPFRMFSARAREMTKGRKDTIPTGEVKLAYRKAGHGVMYQGWIEDFLVSRSGRKFKGRVSLIFTSPPFPLNRKKRYGNFQGDDYLRWLTSLAPRLAEMLTPDGSIVLEIGNAWSPGSPVMDTLPLRALLAFLDAGKLKLCQQFVAYNRARLPAPAQWVTVKRVRVKDAFTHVWWMSPTAHPKADNKKVLKRYSGSMEELIRTGKYNAGPRPSEYQIGKTSFTKNHGGAIRPNVLEFSNTAATGQYQRYCKEHELEPHPARMHPSIAEFFIEFLTDKGELVMDPFAGSNTTGATAQRLGRRWISVEPNAIYVQGSRGRFPGPGRPVSHPERTTSRTKGNRRKRRIRSPTHESGGDRVRTGQLVEIEPDEASIAPGSAPAHESQRSGAETSPPESPRTVPAARADRE